MAVLTAFVSCNKDKDQNPIVGKWEMTHSVEWEVSNGQKMPETKDTFHPDGVYIIEFNTSGSASSYADGDLQGTGSYKVSENGKTITFVFEGETSTRDILTLTSTDLVLDHAITQDDHGEYYWYEDHFKRID